VKSKKILVLGLDKAGKTSIVQSLKGVKNLPSFCGLNPTIGRKTHEFQMLNSEYNIWDFGGQKQYREIYFSRFDEFKVGIDKIIFVIDVQDQERYDIALDYFQNLINLFQDTIEFDISFFLHKFDPDLEITHPEIDDIVVSNLIKKVKSIVLPYMTYSIFKTSIYTVFKKTIIE
jgi:small GTP-binding protein